MAACGSEHAHDLVLVLDGHGLASARVELPAVAQGFVDHGGVLLKVYAIGQQVGGRDIDPGVACGACSECESGSVWVVWRVALCVSPGWRLAAHVGGGGGPHQSEAAFTGHA